jgi:pantoate--beta-alanine ligase
MENRLTSEPLVSEIQYCSVYDPGTLNELEEVNNEALLAIALKISRTRLIDNILVAAGQKPSSPLTTLA